MIGRDCAVELYVTPRAGAVEIASKRLPPQLRVRSVHLHIQASLRCNCASLTVFHQAVIAFGASSNLLQLTEG